MSKLIIATPAYSSTVATCNRHSAICTTRELERSGIPYGWMTVDGCAWVTHARNEIVARFLDMTSSPDDVLLQIDADVGWDPKAPLQMMQHGVEFVAAVQPDKFDGQFKIGTKDPTRQKATISYRESTRLVGPVPRVATCFMMTRRSVFTKMIDAYPEFKITGERHAQGKLQQWYYGFFQMPVRDGRMDGEDHTFCDLWCEIGGEIWVDPWVTLTHGVRLEPTTGSLAKTLGIPEPEIAA